jgi:hypothetical protein
MHRLSPLSCFHSLRRPWLPAVHRAGMLRQRYCCVRHMIHSSVCLGQVSDATELTLLLCITLSSCHKPLTNPILAQPHSMLHRSPPWHPDGCSQACQMSRGPGALTSAQVAYTPAAPHTALSCPAGLPLQGKAAEAEPLYRRCLQLDAQAVQPDNLNSLLILGKELALCVSDKAQRSAAACSTVLVPLTLTLCMLLQGRNLEAQAALRLALAAQQRVLGPGGLHAGTCPCVRPVPSAHAWLCCTADHPDTIMTCIKLSRALPRAEAAALLRQALAAYQRLPEPALQQLRVLMLDTCTRFAAPFVQEVCFRGLRGS